MMKENTFRIETGRADAAREDTMPRIAEPRPPAAPATDKQRERRRRILRAAADLGAVHEFERVQMQEVARRADVALSTLYRYFPSKVHLFCGLMAAGIERFAARHRPTEWSGKAPHEAVADVLLEASRVLLSQPVLAVSMIQATNAADPSVVPDVEYNEQELSALLLQVAGVSEPGERERALVRLVLQSWFGVLQTALNGRLSREQHDDDVRLACRLLLAPLTEERALVTNGAKRATR